MPQNLGNTVRPSGESIWAVDPPSDMIELYRSAGNYFAIVPADFYTPGGVTSPKNSIVNLFNGTRTCPADFFGIHIYDIATTGVPNDIYYTNVRLHDMKGPVDGSGIRWNNINTSAGVRNFANLDRIVDTLANAGKDQSYMFIGTPNFCATSNPNTSKYDNGTTFRASNQPPNATGKAEAAAFITALCQRYDGKQHGRLNSIEVFNETNYNGYWAGTAAELAELCYIVYTNALAVNPNIKILAPTIQEPEGTGAAWATSYLAANNNNGGVGANTIHVFSIHEYPPRYNYGIGSTQINIVNPIKAAAGISALPTWNTETGILFDPERSIDDDWKGRALAKSMFIAAFMGVARYYQYTYDNPSIAMSPRQKWWWNWTVDQLFSGTLQNLNQIKGDSLCATIGGRDIFIQ